MLAAVILLPFFWMLSVSLKPATEPFAIPARLWPSHPTIDNYVSAFRPEFRTYFINSIIVSLSTVVITVTLALLAAYSFSRSGFRIMSVLLALVVVAQMFPGSAIIIPIYQMMRSAHLLNTYASLIIAYVAVTLPVAIWMLRGDWLALLGLLPAALQLGWQAITLEPDDGANALARFRSNRFAGLLVAAACFVSGNA